MKTIRTITVILALFCFSAAANAEPTVEFNHRKMNLHFTTTVAKLKKMEKLMPASLRREIGEEYYPEFRKGLMETDHTKYKKGEASVIRHSGGTITMTLTFPKFILTIHNATWKELDELFNQYFSSESDSYEMASACNSSSERQFQSSPNGESFNPLIMAR